jgi:hypothetical protein
MTEEPLSLRDTARGVAIRAGLLTVGGILTCEVRKNTGEDPHQLRAVPD